MGGKYFEELLVGDVFKHEPGRTITKTDNLLFTALTMNPQPLHLDAEFSGKTEFGQRLVNSILETTPRNDASLRLRPCKRVQIPAQSGIGDGTTALYGTRIGA